MVLTVHCTEVMITQGKLAMSNLATETKSDGSGELAKSNSALETKSEDW